MCEPETDPVAAALASLAGRTVLERERGATRLARLLQEPAHAGSLDLALAARRDWLAADEWETRLAALTARTIVLQQLRAPGLAAQAAADALGLLADPEVRVRFAVGDCLGAAAAVPGVDVWAAAQEPILASIEHCWDRDALVEAPEEPEQGDRGGPPEDYVAGLLHGAYRSQQPGSGELRHGTEGWQALETSFMALRRVVEGSGPAFEPHSTPQLRALLFRATRHPNRFVRETAYHTLACLAGLAAGPRLREWGGELATVLQDGLSENWSQVRYAACVCARSFMLAADGYREAFFPAILPHLCFNRYDVAEGVRSYSLDTWKLVLRDQGPRQVAAHIDQVVAYYVRCAKTNNHTVREAACACLAELFVKLDRAAVAPHLPLVQRTLLRCFKDDSWTVRDAASTAYAKAALAFPDGCRAALPEVWPLWLGMLDENVPSVRAAAAAALADVARAYGDEIVDKLVPVLRSMLLKAREQPAEEEESPFTAAAPAAEPAEPSGSAEPAVATESATASAPGQQDPTAASSAAARIDTAAAPLPVPPLKGLRLAAAGMAQRPQAVASSPSPATPGAGAASPRRRSGSAVPDRMRSPRSPRRPQQQQGQEEPLFQERSLLKAKARDTGGIDYSCGCMDYGFRRPRQPWEAADGAVCCVAELAGVAPAAALGLLPAVAEAALLDHWPQARQLQATVCRQLPLVMRRAGKQAFKPHLEQFLEPVFRCLSCESQLARAAAGACLGSFRDQLGPRIFAGRLSEAQRAAMAASPDVPLPAGAFAGVVLGVGPTGWPQPTQLRA